MTQEQIVDAIYTIAKYADYGVALDLIALAREIEAGGVPPLEAMVDAAHIAKIRAAGL